MGESKLQAVGGRWTQPRLHRAKEHLLRAEDWLEMALAEAGPCLAAMGEAIRQGIAAMRSMLVEADQEAEAEGKKAEKQPGV